MKNFDTLPEKMLETSNKSEYQTWGGPSLNIGGLGGAIFVVNDEACMRYILQTNFHNYIKGSNLYEMLKELTGDGIFNVDGQAWKIHRKIASKMFTRDLLRNSVKISEQKLSQVCNFLDDICVRTAGGSSDSGGDHSIDLQDLFFRFTLDSAALTAFGLDLDSVARGSQHIFATSFDSLQELVHQRFQDPFFKLNRFLQLNQRERAIRRECATIDNFTNEVINSKRKVVDDENVGIDLLSLYMESSISNDANKYGKDSDEARIYLRNIIMNFIIAGRDTTACALSWLFFELSQKPCIVDRIVAEVQSVCGRVREKEEDSFLDADYSMEKLSKLKYTDAVVMEGLRLHPSVPTQVKYAVQNDILPDGTRIPANSSIIYSSFGMQRSKKVWGHDAEEFKPERHLDGQHIKPSAFLNPVFNAGARTCLGKPMAILNIKIVLAYLLPRYTFEDALNHDGRAKYTLVRSMKGGFYTNISFRSR